MKLKLIPNPKKPWARELARSLSPFLKAAGHVIVKKGAEATICIGGDGTILYASHKGRIEGTILGIGSDKSYICQLHRNEWKRVLPVLEGGVVRLMSLQCTLGQRKFMALNDFVVHATHYRVAEMEVSVGSRGRGKTASFEGDGVIVSSPLGSAAYAYSAGGARLAPSERMISVVPICPYKRAFPPSTIPSDGRVVITVGSDCAFITDGVFVRSLRRGEAVSVIKGPDVPFFRGVGRIEE
jgi:NAD+ kinase